MIKKLFLFLCLYCASNPAWSATKAPAKNSVLVLAKAQKEFAEGKYDSAAKWYRKYLRKNRKDGDAWSQLAVCFYYTGEPEKALRYLKKWEPKTKTKSYNQYHQGLILAGQNRESEAVAPLIRAAKSVDDYAARAVFELASIEYNSKDYTRATYWINLYKQRYPQGGAITQILRLDQSITSRIDIKDIQGNKKPDLEKALFKYHPYSLSPIPHYWFARLGYNYNFGDAIQPDRATKEGTKTEGFSKHDLVVHTGIGLGPVTQNELTSYFGYNYRQDWFSEDERFKDYIPFDEFTDLFVYLPFRADLLVRTHRVYADFTYNLPANFSAGALIFQEYSFMGSTLIPGPEGDEVDQKSRYVGEASLLQPYISYTQPDFYEGKFYLYMYKQIIEDAEEFSNKTYNVLGNGDFVMSYALSNKFSFPKYDANINLDLFQLEFIYNDYWLDFTRFGGLFGGDFILEDDLKLLAAVGFYEDTYQLSVPRQGECNFKRGDTAGSESSAPKSCPHKDSGMMYHIGAAYEFSQFTEGVFSYTMIQNKNPDLIIYERTDNIIKFSLTMAFPSYKKVSRFIDRFGDFAFRKEVE